jgi:tetratricopeptide (TPR) repeat protein
VAKRTRAIAPRSDRPVIISLALAALTTIVYAPVRTFELVNWDDPSYITDNPIVRGGLTPASALWALTTTHSPYWHPMMWLSLLLDVSLFGSDAGAYHVTSVAIHIANTVIIFLLLRRMTGVVGPSAFVAAIFAVHPLHVESVAWIAERKDVLSTFFWALTIWAYVSYTRAPSVWRYVVVVVWYALALMSKPMVMTLPVLLLLLDWWPLDRWSSGSHVRLVIEKLPLLAMATATAIATVVVQRRIGAVAGLDVLPLTTRVENAIVSCVVYIWKTVWPTNLAAFYPLHSYPLWVVLVAAASLTAITIAAVRARTRLPHVAVGWLWFLVTVAPVVGLTQAGEQARADRFMYVPMIGLLFIAGWGGGAFLVRIGIWTRAVAAIGLALVASFAIVARAQASYWSDNLTLWQHAVDVTGGNYVAYEKLGEAYRDRGQYPDAEANYKRALQLAPANSPVYTATIHNDLGLVLTRAGRPNEAEAHFAEAVRLNPGFAEAQTNYGNALAMQGKFDDAIVRYQAALALQPRGLEALIGLGAALVRKGRPQDAAVQYREALRVDPDMPQAHNGLGSALTLQHRDDEAMAEFARALELKPDLPSAHLNIAIVLLRKGDTGSARRHLETALSIDPGYEPARNVLARIQ